MPLLRLPFPSLVSLHAEFLNPPLFHNSFKSFPSFSPNISLSILIIGGGAITTIDPNHFRGWQNLTSVNCRSIALDANTLAHLSRMPALTLLDFSLNTTLPVSDAPLFFSALDSLRLHSETWKPISQLLSRTCMPVVTSFDVSVRENPSRQSLRAFLASASSAVGRTVKYFTMDLWKPRATDVRSEALFLCLEDVQSFMAFNNLRHLEIGVEWSVGLTDAELLTLASAWPYLEQLEINRSYGWNTRGGITPNGLVQLLHTCRLLHHLCLAVDTRGYTELELPASGALTSLESRSCPFSFLNALDSIIEEVSVPVIAAFFATIPHSSDFIVWGWGTIRALSAHPDYQVYFDRWEEVHRRILDMDRLRS